MLQQKCMIFIDTVKLTSEMWDIKM